MKTFMYKLNILIFLFLMLFAGICYAVGGIGAVPFGSDLTTLNMQDLLAQGNMAYDDGTGKYILPFSIAGGDGFYELTINGRKVNRSEIYSWDGSSYLEYEGEVVEDNEGRAYFEFDQFNAFSGTGNYSLFIDPEDVSTEGVITEQWIAANLTELQAKKELEAEQMKEDEEDPSITNLAAKFFMSIAKVINYCLQLALKQATTITIDNIVFNEYEATRLDFFSSSSSGSNSLASILREPINNCYTLFFSIAIVGYFAILIYVGIKVLLKSTNASERATYKNAVLYWIAGLAILFLMPFYMKYTISLNDAFVRNIANSRPAEAQDKEGAKINSSSGYFFPNFDAKDGEEPAIDFKSGTDYMSQVGYLAESTNQVGVAIAYLLMTWQLIVMCVYYYKRVFMTAFLIIIFPLIGLTYAWDKLNDGKSQALSSWLTEFTTGVFVQSFHAIIFCFVTSAIYSSLESVDGVLVKADFILLMIASSFMFQGEVILRQIFTGGTDGGNSSAYGTLASTAPKIAATGFAAASLTGRVIKNTVGTTGYVVSGVRNFQKWRVDRILTKQDSDGVSNFKKLAVNTRVQTRRNELLPADPNVEITPEIKLAAESTEILNNMENHTSEEINEALQMHKRLMREMKNMNPETRKYVEAILKKTKFSEAQLDRVDRAMIKAATAASHGVPTEKIIQELRIEVELAFPPNGSDNKKLTDKVYRAALLNMKNNIVSRGVTRRDIESSWNNKIDTIDEINDNIHFATKDTSATPEERIVRDRITRNTDKIQKQILNNFKKKNIALTKEQKVHVFRYAGAIAVAREAGTGIFDEDTGRFNELQEANDILHHDYQFGNSELKRIRDENINIKALEKSIANRGKVSRKNRLLEVRVSGLIDQYKQAMGGQISEEEEKILQRYSGKIATLEQLNSGEFSAYDSYKAISGLDSIRPRLAMTEEEMTTAGLTDYEKQEARVVRKLLKISSLDTDLDTYKYVIAKKIHSGGDSGPDRRVFKYVASAQYDESRKWAASTVESMETRAFNMFKDSDAYIQQKRGEPYADGTAKNGSKVDQKGSQGGSDSTRRKSQSENNEGATRRGASNRRKSIAEEYAEREGNREGTRGVPSGSPSYRQILQGVRDNDPMTQRGRDSIYEESQGNNGERTIRRGASNRRKSVAEEYAEREGNREETRGVPSGSSNYRQILQGGRDNDSMTQAGTSDSMYSGRQWDDRDKYGYRESQGDSDSMYSGRQWDDRDEYGYIESQGNSDSMYSGRQWNDRDEYGYRESQGNSDFIYTNPQDNSSSDGPIRYRTPKRRESVIEEFFNPARGGDRDEEISPVVSIYNIIAASNGKDDTRKGIADLDELTQNGAYTPMARSIIDDMSFAARTQNQRETNAAQDFATEALDIFDKENPNTDETNEQLTYNGYTYNELLEHEKASLNGVTANATGALLDVVTMPFSAVAGATSGMAFSSDGMPLAESLTGAVAGVTVANVVTDKIVNVVEQKKSNAEKVSDIENRVKKRLEREENDRLKAKQAFEDAAYETRNQADTYLELRMAAAQLFVSPDGQMGATVIVQAQNAQYIAVNEIPSFTWQPYQEQINYMFKDSNPNVAHNLYIYVKDDSGNIKGTQLLDIKP